MIVEGAATAGAAGFPRFLPPLPYAAVEFARRGFNPGHVRTQLLLESRAHAFVHGYELQRNVGRAVHPALAGIQPDNRGFAYEGAALAAATADLVRPARGRRRAGPARVSHLEHLLAGPGAGFVHLAHVGVGWLGAVLPPRWVIRRPGLDPLLRWLALDGAGFAKGFFRGYDWIRRLADRPDRRDSTQAVSYQGVGRSLWFVECGDVSAIGRQIVRFPAALRPELWAGVGLAACYAGGSGDRQFEEFDALTGSARAALAQGASFAAEARRRSGHIPTHTHRAVAVLAGVPLQVAADWARDCEGTARSAGPEVTAYRLWQTEIRKRAEAVGR